MEHSQADKERGPFWRIWAAERPRRSTLKRNHMGRSVLPKRSTRRTAKETMSITAEKVTPPHPTPPNQSPTPAQCVCLQANMNVIIPDPTPPNQSPTPAQCVCFEDEHYYPTPPHPTKARPQLSACVCKRT